MANKPCFQHEMSEDVEEFEMIYFSDGYCWQELWASEVNAILNLRMQVEMMLDEGGEMAFTDLVERSIELQNCFKEVVECLKLSKSKRLKKTAEYG